jgi:hypothetical protein
MSALRSIVRDGGARRRRAMIAVMVALTGLLVAPAAVLADNCSTLLDCWSTAGGAAATAIGIGVAGGLFGGMFGGGGDGGGDGGGAGPDGDGGDDDCT